MKQTAAFLLIIFVVALPFFSVPVFSGELAWEELAHWKLKDAKPVAVATSFEKNLAFVLADDGTVHVFSQDGSTVGAIPVGRAATAIAVSVRGDLLYVTEADTKKIRILAVDFLSEFDLTDSPFLGPADAPVVVVDFSDFECPYCAKMPALMEQILEQNPGRIKVVFKHFPLPMHRFAEAAARAAIAANMQGKFWQMHDLLFANQKQLSLAKIIDLAKEAGLDMKRFRKDFDSEAVKKILMRDVMEGRKAGISGTPSLLVNGRKVRQSTLPSLQQRIDEAIMTLSGKK